MKKILFIVSVVFFLVSSYLFVDVYSNKEVAGILEENSNYTISVKDVSDQNETIKIFREVARDNKVNVQKVVYRLQSNDKFIIDVYVDINNPEAVLKNIIIDGKKLSNDDLESAYMSSRKEGSEKLTGTFSLLDNENVINLRRFTDAKKENLNGVYSFSGISSNEQFNQIKKQLVDQNIKIEDNFASHSTGSFYNSKMTLFIPIIFMLLILTSLYNYIMKFKEYSVMMLNGYDIKEIIKNEIKFYFKLNMILVSAAIIIMIVIHYVNYGVFNYFLYLYLLIRLLGIALVTLIVQGVCGLLLKRVKIQLCLKNEKPSKEINLISIITKVCFCIVFLFTSITTIVKVKSLEELNVNMDDWKETINYAFTTMFQLPHTENGNTYEIGLKCQKLFESMEKQGALMMRPGWYFRKNAAGKELFLEEQSIYGSDFIEVNNNYLQKYPVYDKEGRQLDFSGNEDILTFLIPKKYEKNLDEIKELYEDYPDLRYLDENLYNELKGLPENNARQEMRYIVYESHEKFFSYDPEVNKEEANYITDPIIMVTNANNRGTDIYLSMMTMGEFLMPISNPEDPYSELYPAFKELDLAKYIPATPTVYSRVDQQQYDLQQTLMEYASISFLSMIGYIIITIFISMNYVESNKRINAIKTFMGYSFVDRYKKYYIMNIIPFTIIPLLIGLSYKEIALGIYLSIFLFAIDFIVTTIVLLYYQKKSLSEVLKGE